MKEELILFETAKLAKEKGFKISCYRHYNNEKKLIEHSFANGSSTDVEFKVELDDLNENFNYYSNKFNAPTQSLLQKWLREKYNIHIKIDDFLDINNNIDWDFEIVFIGTDIDSKSNYKPKIPFDVNRSYKTYEETLEKSLQEALKLI